MKIKKALKALIVKLCAEKSEIKRVHDFYCNYNGFRSLAACAKQTGLDIWLCEAIKEHLYENRLLGLYYFKENFPPQKHMRKYILKKFSQIKENSYILEVGPGENPLFPVEQYKNWYAVDKYFEDSVIKFKGLDWAKNKYPPNKIFLSSFEDLNKVLEPRGLSGRFDIVVASHSYEHVFKPIESLKQANKALVQGGIICLFVPDAFTDDPNTKDPTHTLYLVPQMMEEFFHYAGGFKDISIEPFRPNTDLVITAIKG